MNVSATFFKIVRAVALVCVVGATFFCVSTASAFAPTPVDAGLPTANAAPPIRVENYSDGDVQRYPVALVRGAAPGVDVGTVVVENLSSALPTRISRATVRGGRFKILVELVPGPNRLSVAVGASRIDLTLFYRRREPKYFVRLIYFVDSTGDASFEIPAFLNAAPSPTLSQNYRGKIRTAATLWQTATAERLNDAGFGRRTFALETDKNGEIAVVLWRGKKTAAEYRALSEAELFREIYREIADAPQTTEFVRSFVLVGFARRDAANKTVKTDKSVASNGRIALGGRSIAVLDATTLFAWPDSLADVERFFADSAPIPEEFAADSGFRRVRWALSASTLGAGLHELGHAFGLGHSRAENDVMSRGFDRFNRIFSVVEPPSAPASEPTFFSDESATTWNPESAKILLRSFWIEE